MTYWTAAWALWMTFIGSWYAAALWTGKAVRRTSAGSRARDYLFYTVGFVLLFLPPRAAPTLWRDPSTVAAGLIAMEVGAFAFAWWARLHLGRLWSGMITLREGHRIVDTGPYRYVRHPIYTGYAGAAWAFAFLSASPCALLGAALLTAQMTWKAWREERFLREELGAAGYDAYAARTPMLVPFAPR